MRFSSVFVLSGLVLGLVVAGGCLRDPEKAKKEYLEKGNRYVSQQNYDAAVIEYRNAIQQDPKFGLAYLKLGMVYLQIKDMRNALGASVRAADLLPTDLEAQLQAG